MKILLVSWSTLPYPGGSSVIVENLAKNFAPEELIVLGSTTLWGAKVPDRGKHQENFRYFFSEMYLFGRGYRYFIWFRRWRFKPLIEKIKSIIREEKIDHVIGVYPNDFYCYAACLSAKALQIPFSSYFHNTYADNVAILDTRAEKIQQEIFNSSARVFVMSKGMQAFYREKYRLENVLPLVHTFSELPLEESLSGIPGENKKCYKLVAIGNFNESNLEATIRFVRAIKGDARFSLSLYTHVPKVLLEKRGLDTDVIEHMGFVSPDTIHDLLQFYDICVLTHGFTGGYGEVEYRTIFPTRTIPFLLSGKPIIAHSPPGSFLNEFIRENQCAELVDQTDTGAILDGLNRIIYNEKYQRQLVKAAQVAARQFYGPEVVEKLKAHLAQASQVI